MIRNGRSIPELLADVFSQTGTLVRKEVQLARAEISNKVARAATGLGLVVGGSVLLTPALVILLQAGASALSEQYGFTPAISALIVGGITLVVGLILFIAGFNCLKFQNLMPNKTIHQLQEDASLAKEMGQRHDLRRAA
ncbi:MAG TPA: phage holin family protein [Xanthobacteraceae bacterium]|nr:phage holin family protein [Xanthobacteraceae bacterium]